MAAARRPLSEIVASAANAVLGTPAAAKLDRLLRDSIDAKATATSRAMDDAFIRTGIGGSHHRVFDGGHDVPGAFAAARSTHPDAGFARQLGEAVRELWKDMATPRGIPLLTLDKAQFEEFAAFAAEAFGIKRDWLLDMATMTATELGGAAAAGAAFAMGRLQTDSARYFRLCGSLGMSAAVAANPVLAAGVVVTILHAARRGHLGRRGLSSMSQGALVSGTLLAAGSLAGPVGFVAAGVAILLLVTYRWLRGRMRLKRDLAAYRKALIGFARLPPPPRIPMLAGR